MSCAREVRYRPTRFMPVERDIAVVVGEKTPPRRHPCGEGDYGDLGTGDLVRRYDPPVPAGKKSLALRLVYQPRADSDRR